MQHNPFTNPSDEAYRLKRPEKKEYGFNIHTLLFEVLFPAIVGACATGFLNLALPALLKSFQQNTMRYFSDYLSREYTAKVTPLLNMDFSQSTFLWVLVFGALLGITVKYFTSQEKPK